MFAHRQVYLCSASIHSLFEKVVVGHKGTSKVLEL